jgi:hypothetical protein
MNMGDQQRTKTIIPGNLLIILVLPNPGIPNFLLPSLLSQSTIRIRLAGTIPVIFCSLLLVSFASNAIHPMPCGLYSSLRISLKINSIQDTHTRWAAVSKYCRAALLSFSTP